MASYFELDHLDVKKICKQVGSATALWHRVAEKLKIKRSEIERIASAFEHEDLQKTRK